MGKKAPFIIIIIVIIIILVLLFYYGISSKYNKYNTSYKYNKRLQKTETYTSSLNIENYIFTKLERNKALLRVYGINNNNKSVTCFPIIINYYSRGGKLLGSDKVDLLKNNGAVLKPMGKINAEVHLIYPENTEKVEVKINKN